MQGPGNQVAYRQDAPIQVPPPVQVDPQANGQPLMDPNMIVEDIKLHFGVQLKPLDRSVYKKPYPDWVDRIPLTRGYKALDFSTFSREDGKFTMEHISHFLAQYGEAKQK